jgi:hypothetical protein
MHARNVRQLWSRGMPDKAAVDRAQATRMPLVPAIAWAAAKDLRESRVRNFLTKHKSRWGRR